MLLTDTTAALRLLVRSVLDDDERDLAGAPQSVMAAAGQGPAGVGLFLHRVEEQPRGVAGEPRSVRDTAGRVVAWQAPPRTFRLSYLVWAWSPDDGDGEYDLLSKLLDLFAAHECLPQWALSGCLETGRPNRLAAAQADAPHLGALWSAAGLGPRTAFEVTVTVDLVPAPRPATDRLVDVVDLRTSGRPR
ncbi:Pvc16 family protein [Streptomyces vinaceus]|uniref:Pvc16 family protein n=1 Tax=Streptomyces vinaceus TaxID=1960 RepID=UPI003830E5AE